MCHLQEARALPGVGEKLANKVWEIIESGELRKLDEISSTEEIKTINLFTNIWGAGATTARHWWAQGFRTLEDLTTKVNIGPGAHFTRLSYTYKLKILVNSFETMSKFFFIYKPVLSYWKRPLDIRRSICITNKNKYYFIFTSSKNSVCIFTCCCWVGQAEPARETCFFYVACVLYLKKVNIWCFC